MGKGMKESNIEGLASHDGPESCASPREGAGEAFDRGKCRQGNEPREYIGFGVPTLSSQSEGNTAQGASGCGGDGGKETGQGKHREQSLFVTSMPALLVITQGKCPVR